ncbi:MAG: hypothetical protein OEV37_03920 [Candidatus Berkelbacteria bacterium]|nr:hypothetical protein [Candidatus Berkelbacteria bacterium]
MVEGEGFGPEPEKQEEREPSVEDVSRACQEVLGAEVAEDFRGLELDEAIGYAYTLLLDSGHDPDEILSRHGIIINGDEKK